MNRAEMKTRDAELVAAYFAGVKPRALAQRYAITEAGVFLILKRSGITTRIHRGAWAGATVADAVIGSDGPKSFDRDSAVLVANGFSKTHQKATALLRKADYFQRNPHQFMLKDLGVTNAKMAEVNRTLSGVKAYITLDAPFSVFFTTRNAFLSLTFRQLLLFVAAPFAYIMAHKDEVRDFNGMLAPLAQPGV